MTTSIPANDATVVHARPDGMACTCRIPAQSGRGFRLKRGDVLRVIDPHGEQVSDLFAFKDGDSACSLSSGRTIDYAGKIYLTTGDVLWSNDSQPMFTIMADDVGRHDFLLTPCSQEMFEILYKHRGHHPSCFENLRKALAPFGIRGEQISTTFNIFMRVDVDPGGAVSVKPPLSKPGDALWLRAEMDLVCALTACSAEGSNNGSFKPIDFEITPGGGGMTTPRAPVVERLVELIATHGWQSRFEQAVLELRTHSIPCLAAIDCLDDYLGFLDDMVRWAPRERTDSLRVHDKLVEFHFLLDQPALRSLQAPTGPAAPLSPLSAWIVDFAKAWGAWLDTPASAVHVDSFRANAAFRWDDYMPPPSGYLTFNQFFARHVKPGRRPVDAPCDASVLVSPADANFIGQWRIDADSVIEVADEKVSLKRLRWSLAQLLDGSPFATRFAGGVFTHSALRTFDYHRWHAPLDGKVVEARVIQGRAWLDVEVVDEAAGGRNVRGIEAVEGTGWQFAQTRGLVVLDTACGLVACLPVGMAQVSSVVITAELGVRLRKGEEMGYFQFGGSDFAMVFEARSNVVLEGVAEQHVQQGRRVGSVDSGANPAWDRDDATPPIGH